MVLRQDGLLHFVAMPLFRLLQCNFFVCCNATFPFAALLSRFTAEKSRAAQESCRKRPFLALQGFVVLSWPMVHDPWVSHFSASGDA